MNEQTFYNKLTEKGISLTEKQRKQFSTYYNLLIEWNEKVNLTAITQKEEVYLKHFYDSITPAFYDDFTIYDSICDIGAGAGFPSLPLHICFPHLKVTIIDSLRKRTDFLQEVVNTLQLNHIHIVHGRAEQLGQDPKYRQKYSIVTARAVAQLNVLAEYCLPFCKKNGYFIAFKGTNINMEIDEAAKAIDLLGGQIKKIEEFTLPSEESKRSLLWVEKIKNTPKKYPRKAGTPNKHPLK